MVERQISFDFAALFHSPIRAVKKGGNFKIDLLMDQIVSILFCLCSSSEEASWKVAWCTERFCLWRLKCSGTHSTLHEANTGSCFLLWHVSFESTFSVLKLSLPYFGRLSLENLFPFSRTFPWEFLRLYKCCFPIFCKINRSMIWTKYKPILVNQIFGNTLSDGWIVNFRILFVWIGFFWLIRMYVFK